MGIYIHGSVDSGSLFVGIRTRPMPKLGWFIFTNVYFVTTVSALSDVGFSVCADSSTASSKAS